ncbi:pum [Symbiodinium pilosum]|uniref:Pum protein n=1 Tax=Symbiodinium pilosum TaxID=2952 RepID=A0A812MGI7_SYMPI|nr:pum [Symbiodinium pilosum]
MHSVLAAAADAADDPDDPDGVSAVRAGSTNAATTAYADGAARLGSAANLRRLRRRRAAERKAREEAIDLAHNVGSEGKQHQKPWKQESSEAQLRGRVWALAQDKDGCRLVQKALEKLARKGGREAATIAWELRGHILEAIKHPHGNYVIQKAVAQLSVGSSSFIVQAIQGSAIMVAKHRMGCRTLCRLLEFCSTNPQVGRLVDELMPEISELCCHSFAHHVVESVMEHGEERHKHRIARTLLTDVMRFADHKNTSYLIEKVLSNCSDEDQRAMLYALDLNRIIDLAKTRYGRHVAKTMLQDRRWYTAWGAEKSEQLISPWKSELEADCFGFLFLKDMAKSWR